MLRSSKYQVFWLDPFSDESKKSDHTQGKHSNHYTADVDEDFKTLQVKNYGSKKYLKIVNKKIHIITFMCMKHLLELTQTITSELFFEEKKIINFT